MLTLPSTKKAAINMTGKAPAPRNRQNTKGSALLYLAKTVTRTPYAPKPSWAATKAHHTRGVIFCLWTFQFNTCEPPFDLLPWAAVSCRESSTVGHLETDVLLRVRWGVVSQCKQELGAGGGGACHAKMNLLSRITLPLWIFRFEIMANYFCHFHAFKN